MIEIFADSGILLSSMLQPSHPDLLAFSPKGLRFSIISGIKKHFLAKEWAVKIRI